MITPTDSGRNWFQRRLDRFTGNDEPTESTFSNPLSGAAKSSAERAEARAPMAAFRQEHGRA